MENSRELINELIVDIFWKILMMQEEAIRSKGVSLSITEMHTLEAIDKAKENNKMSDIASDLNVTASTLSINITRLVKKGYVQKVRAEHDRRVTHLQLTDKAHDALQVHHLFHEELIDSLISDLKVNEDKVLIESLNNVLVHLRQIQMK
ncbi:MAG TPA: winged helix DNA-binding protein [Erysipelothrix sp.]|jgi:DNA-binding MarR family transcriptional regulator|nr:winged helix DNA-binding protein [Erysipelothrix sp.]